jgi:dephospho-CoA kinase
MKVIGLTGGIGSGKTTVGALLVEKGAVLVDADTIVREVQEPGTPVFEQMVERFGAGIVAADGRLDRQAVADIVFNDPDALAALNGIVHPAVGIEIVQRIAAHEGTGNVVIADIPLLAEGNSRIAMSGVIVVDVPTETQVDRLVGFRGFTEADARARIAKQATREDRLAKADFVIDNSGEPDALPAQVDAAWQWITTLPDTPRTEGGAAVRSASE